MQRQPFQRAVQAFDGAMESDVAVEEVRPIVDVLRHAIVPFAGNRQDSRRVPVLATPRGVEPIAQALLPEKPAEIARAVATFVWKAAPSSH